MSQNDLLRLPKPILIKIFCDIEHIHIINLCLVNKHFNSIFQSDIFWKIYCQRRFEDVESMYGDTYKEKYINSFEHWDKDLTSKNMVIRNRDVSIEQKDFSGLTSARTKMSFEIGKENALFIFKMKYSYVG